jgi:acetylornithine deacetylase
VKSRLTYNADKTKANLFATLGEGKPAGIILSGHTDTVPWDGQDWSMDPLSALVQGRQAVRPRQRRHEGLHRPWPWRRPSSF